VWAFNKEGEGERLKGTAQNPRSLSSTKGGYVGGPFVKGGEGDSFVKTGYENNIAGVVPFLGRGTM